MKILTFCGIPLHAVFASDLSEVVLDDCGQGSVVQVVVVNLSTEVDLALGLELAVQSTRTSCASSGSGVAGVGSSSRWWVSTRATR